MNTSNKERHAGAISALKVTIGVLMTVLAFEASAAFPATEAEMALIPSYCKDTQGFGYGDATGNTSPRARSWVAMMGDTFWHMHHYCVALLQRNRALKAGVDPERRRGLWQSALGEYNYVLGANKDKNFVLLPEIYTRVGEAELKLSNFRGAEEAFARARKIKPDYWPAYSHWAEYLIQAGKRAEAKALVKSGLEETPQAKVLIEQYRLLGGNPAGISPKSKKSDKDDMPNEDSAKTATLPGGATGPTEANVTEEPTKEGENGSK